MFRTCVEEDEDTGDSIICGPHLPFSVQRKVPRAKKVWLAATIDPRQSNRSLQSPHPFTVAFFF